LGKTVLSVRLTDACRLQGVERIHLLAECVVLRQLPLDVAEVAVQHATDVRLVDGDRRQDGVDRLHEPNDTGQQGGPLGGRVA